MIEFVSLILFALDQPRPDILIADFEKDPVIG